MKGEEEKASRVRPTKKDADILIKYRIQKTKAEAELKRKQVERAEMEIAIMVGEFMRRDLAHEQGQISFNYIFSELFAMLDDMPGILEGLKAVGIRKKMEQRINLIADRAKDMIQKRIEVAVRKTMKLAKERAKAQPEEQADE